jgi:hypothetical protein
LNYAGELRDPGYWHLADPSRRDHFHENFSYEIVPGPGSSMYIVGRRKVLSSSDPIGHFNKARTARRYGGLR